MFDFIKRMFKGKKERSSASSRNVGKLDVVENNDIEILKTSDYSEGAPKAAIEQLVAERAMPPAHMTLPAANLELPVDSAPVPVTEIELPEAQLDEPSDEPAPAIAEAEESQEADNYLLGDLEGARKQRENQTRKAGIQYWSEGLVKYRPRKERPAADGTTGKSSNYFDVLREEPMLRKVELESPGMSIEQLNLSKYIHGSMKGKMVNEFILRSMKLIRDQQENGIIPVWDEGTEPGADSRGMHLKTLRGMFNAFEAQQRAAQEARGSQGALDAQRADIADADGDELTVPSVGELENMNEDDIDELLKHFAEFFEHVSEDDNKDSYNRWLLAVAEDANVSDDVLWLLVEDENPDVRFCLAENYNIDPNMLQQLSNDENPYVAHRAQKTLLRMQNANGRIVDRDFGIGDNRMRRLG